jgi:hypothetical protein
MAEGIKITLIIKITLKDGFKEQYKIERMSE